MDQQHANAAIAVCTSFLARLSSLQDAIIDIADDVDPDPELDPNDGDPEQFSSNDIYRTTFAMVVSEEFDPRSVRHQAILLQYHRLLSHSVHHEHWVLFEPASAQYQAAVERWESWAAVGARWPFEVPEKTEARDVVRVCTGMWKALRMVAAAALREEARVGLCEFDVLAEGGVARRGVAGVADVTAEGVGARIVGWAGRLCGVKTKQD